MNDLIINPNSPMVVPEYLQGVNTGLNQSMLAAVMMGGNRIGLKGSRFRIIVNGKEEGIVDANYFDVIILGAHEANSRIFYENAYKSNEKNSAPSCYSADGVAPPDDVKVKQSEKCAICPQNVTGSKITDSGYKTKACGYFRRLVVMMAGDLAGTAYQLDVKAMGLFGDSHANTNQYSLNDYIKFVSARNVDMGVLVTRLSFDTDQSVPKLLFAANRYVTQEEMAVVRERAVAEDVRQMTCVNMNTIDLSNEVTAPDEEPAPVPAQVVKPVVAQVIKPVAATPQAVKPTVAAPQVVKPATQVQTVTRVGQPAPATTAPQVIKPTAAPQQTIKPATAPQIIRAPVQAPAAIVEVADDAELASILAGLED